ncbi:competence/damage-inducible protein A [Limosilactobacillus sp. STM2_1]|uniref:Putative competence-damage inducible protein n=1 Tax=Limosilactobacillus rudii TaxID=2759755 RepID=A0A7W3YP36_9LACO|nr:competence/damage-inducible protein A [Limosilactobacillus rudii]MBB1079874.1 competence/damage-inducible protein A [Limosilactobacillus rudii]MBB1097952.1 competence/damage-inducible protein A [Limosilactobacillus rudii]MCD7135021.1 competence/damage-inducible protein A [Limosilactobacillus rudii]
MDAEIISVGNELVLGQITNTNVAYLAAKLTQLDLTATYQTTVDDDRIRLERVINHALTRSQLVFVCGGLGPTTDDITMPTVAATMGVSLQTDQRHWKWIQEKFNQRQISMEPENIRQAKYLVGGEPLANPVGLALGCWYETGGKVIVVLPGPPAEFKAMVDKSLLPKLQDYYHTEKQIISRTLNFLGRPESQLMDEIATVTKNEKAVVITSYVQPTAIQVRLTVRDLPFEEANQRIDRVQAAILQVEEPYFFGVGDNLTLAEVVVNLLRARHLKLTAAESLTGGLFQSTVCSVPGASNVFDGGFVTYAASAKEKLLDIPAMLISKHGVVSSETAAAMGEGCREKFHADIGIGFTGVAGPDSLEGQPAGTVWIGLAIKGRPTVTRQLHLAAYIGRQAIRTLSVQYGLQMIYRELKN